MGNFADAIKSDKGLQQKVVEAIKGVASDNGHTLDDKAYSAGANAADSCAETCDSYCLCTL